MTRYYLFRWADKPRVISPNLLISWFSKANFDFLKQSKIAILTSLSILIIGATITLVQGKKLLGMDFTGGASISFVVDPKENCDYRQTLEEALLKKGLTTKDFQIQQLTSPTNIRLFLSQSAKELATSEINKSSSELTWLNTLLKKADLSLSTSSKSELDSQWTMISGKMSDTMRKHALQGLLIALVIIVIYLTFRFEFKYGISALICLFHDVFFSIAAIAILNFFHVDIQIDLHTIAAIMTIIGYSLNDTIIIFDRIREQGKWLTRRHSFKEVVNHALNATLSRTLMTSSTTFIALLSLVILGGPTVFSFALIMTLGVIFGTLSSLFIAAPFLVWLNDLQEKRNSMRETSS